jgi:tetratricopeptide (TPR) repeat protein
MAPAAAAVVTAAEAAPTAAAQPAKTQPVAAPPQSSVAPRIAQPQPAVRRLLETPVAQTRPAPRVHPKVESAYAAYLAGDLAAARADYQVALQEESANRDALLGLAAIDVRSGRYEVAEAAYLRLLQNNPADAHAQAGLIALRASRLDPLATESRVKSMLAADPGANVLHFTLGNQLAQQGRWGEAQQEYFKAFAAEPDNADFAFNLAVSLDHLRQPKLALDYYRRAIVLAEKRGASFDLAAARSRAAQLGN